MTELNLEMYLAEVEDAEKHWRVLMLTRQLRERDLKEGLDIYPHSFRAGVMYLAVASAIEPKLPEKYTVHAIQSALLHDIGKSAVPAGLLRKKGQLTESEKEKMHQHADEGYRIITAECPGLHPVVAHVAKEHHNILGRGKYDGRKDISREERKAEAKLTHIVAACDGWDALRCRRVYRDEEWEPQGIFGELKARFTSKNGGRKGNGFWTDILGILLETDKEVSEFFSDEKHRLYDPRNPVNPAWFAMREPANERFQAAGIK